MAGNVKQTRTGRAFGLPADASYDLFAATLSATPPYCRTAEEWLCRLPLTLAMFWSVTAIRARLTPLDLVPREMSHTRAPLHALGQ